MDSESISSEMVECQVSNCGSVTAHAYATRLLHKDFAFREDRTPCADAFAIELRSSPHLRKIMDKVKREFAMPREKL